MHPAASVIVFTTLSGAGFGLLAFLGIGEPAPTGLRAFWFYLLGYGLAVAGLLASTLHLANPRNAIKAFREWRSSWLSREAVLSVTALIAVAPVAFGRVFLGQDWPVLGVIGAALCLLVVFSTSMIYAQLRTVPRWNTPLTPVVFLAFALAGGAILAGRLQAALAALAVLGCVQLAAWIVGDRRFAQAGSDAGTATGLGRIGRVRLLEPPHAGRNYVLDEMAFRVGRRHAAKLRILSLVGAVVLPGILLATLGTGVVVTAVAAILHLAGALASRWLFFAEARHVVGLYYGR
ncbi:MAG: dibenzothiophene desulfurase [Alphaproteobacteria bacterium]|nr:MAG: dibenzothiophene desulfurase [Alphaproteobacteria bacterium]